MKLPFRTSLLLTATIAALAVPLLAPMGAHAILAGAEANGELVNSDRDPALQAFALDKMQKQGVQVVRGNFGWNEIATGPCAGQGTAALENHLNDCYNWTLLDSLVSQANARRIHVLISLTRVPTWVLGNPDPTFMGHSSSQFQTLLAHYVAFHKAAATRYRAGSPFGTIRFWTVHNESNSPQYWAPRPNPQRYALLYARTAVAIKSAYPGAQVAPGPTNPTGGPPRRGGIKPLRFVKLVQPHLARYLPGSMAKKRTYVNAWAHNPYPGTFTQPSRSQGTPHAEAITMSTINRLISQLDRHPLTRGTKVWGTEFGWETTGNTRVTEARQAQFVAEAFHWLATKRRVTIGISYGLTDNTDPVDWQSGTFRPNGTPKLSFRMFQRMVSVPQAGVTDRVRRGTRISVWGKANIMPASGILAYNIPGKQCAPRKTWCSVPGQRRNNASGEINAMFKVNQTTRFAVWSKGNPAAGVSDGYGLYRQVRIG